MKPYKWAQTLFNMFSLQHIKEYIILGLLLLIPLSSFTQRDSVKYIKSPYRTEYTPYFEFGKFKRGFSNDSLKIALDILESKPRKEWSRTDSLNFAQISLRTGNSALSNYYYENLDASFKYESDYWFDQLIISYINGEYARGLGLITRDSPMVLQYSKVYFFRKIFQAKIEEQKTEKWYKSNEVLNWELDSTLNLLDRESPEFETAVIEPLLNLEEVLKLLISYVYEEDAVIANTCREMGHFIEFHLYLTQAHIAFSLGRHYNKWDKELLTDLKAVKAKISEKKYKIPVFRKHFPRIEYWRFDYNVLKEKVMFAKNDTTEYVMPETMQPKPEPMINFPSQFIIIGGILLFFLIVLLFLRTRKN